MLGVLFGVTLGAALWVSPSSSMSYYRVDTSRVWSKVTRDLESEQDSIAAHGFYQVFRYEIWPLEAIEEVEPWSNERLNRVLEAIHLGIPLPPIHVDDPERGDKLWVSDGIHRLTGSRLQGFTHIPVIRTTTIKVS